MATEPTTSPRHAENLPRQTSPDVPSVERPERRRLHWLPRYTWSGTTGALLAGLSSLTPSLLPRGWLLQGVIAGITAAIGYGLGIAVAWFVHELTGRRPSPRVRRRAWQWLAVLGTVLGLVLLWAGQRWQAEVHRLMGLEPTAAYTSVGIVAVAVILFAVLIATARMGRRITRWVARLAGRVLPRRLARPLAVVAVGSLALFLLNGVLTRGLVEAANTAFSEKDGSTDKGVVQPTAPQRSGSPTSLASWDSLGRQGRNFVGKGPTPAQLSAFSGRPAPQ